MGRVIRGKKIMKRDVIHILQHKVQKLEEMIIELKEQIKENKVIRANSLIIKGKGNERILLEIQPDGMAVVAIHDKDGRLRIWFGVDSEGSPWFELRDKDGNVCFCLSISPCGTPKLIMGMEGKKQIMVSIIDVGELSLIFFDEQGNTIFQIPLQRHEGE
jgi:hypothetical protein